MLVVIPFFAGDKAQAVRLTEWITELGGVSKHDCLLAVHKDTDSRGVIEPLRKAFRRVAEFSITDEMIVEREQHAYAANLMWKRTANHIADMNEPAPWLWVEPDAVPITAGWLDSIAAAYTKCGKPFMHDLVETPRGKSNSGCGVYPAKVRDYTDRLWELSNVSWDVLLYPDFAPHTAYTPLIQDIGFMPGTKELPTFPDADSLSRLRPEAVLFHRCKDGTLIDRLCGQNSGTVLLASAPAKSGDGGSGLSPSLTPAAPPVQFTYNLEDLNRLRECLTSNAGRLSSALVAFGAVTLPWLEFAEQIKADPRFPEKHFGQPSDTIAPKKKSNERKKRKLTPEHKAKLKAALAKAREAKAQKSKS